jgi:hypothetical protein
MSRDLNAPVTGLELDPDEELIAQWGRPAPPVKPTLQEIEALIGPAPKPSIYWQDGVGNPHLAWRQWLREGQRAAQRVADVFTNTTESMSRARRLVCGACGTEGVALDERKRCWGGCPR